MEKYKKIQEDKFPQNWEKKGINGGTNGRFRVIMG